MAKNIYQVDYTQKPFIFELIERRDTAMAIEVLTKDPSFVNQKGWMDDTPLHKAAFCRNFKIVEYLVKNGAEVNARRADGGTALYWAGTAEIAECLIAHGAVLDDDNYYNPLNWAVRNKRADVMEVLIKHGMDVNGNDKHPILEVKDIDCLSVFVKHNANINLLDNDGYNVLHWIAWSDNAPLFDYALSVGVKWCRNNAGETPYHIAKRSANRKIVNMLKKKHPLLINNKDVDLDVPNEYSNHIRKFIFIASNNTIISIGQNACLSLWQITDNEIGIKKCIQLNISNISSIAYSDGENFFIVPNKNGVLEFRDIETLSLISSKQLPITSDICTVSYSADRSYILVAESWSPIYKLNLDFEIEASSEIDNGISDFSFDKNSKLIGIECYDQNELVELHKLNDDGTLHLIKDFFVEGEAFSSAIYFNPDTENFLISYSKTLIYYSYQNSEPEIVWKKNISHLSKPHCCGSADYINADTFVFGYGNTVEIINCSTSTVLKTFTLKDKKIKRIQLINDKQKALVATDTGFVLIDIKADSSTSKKAWWNFMG